MVAGRAEGPGSPRAAGAARWPRYAAAGEGTNHGIARTVGQAVVEAIAAFAAGDFGRAADLLLPVRYDIWRMGGSHAQRDLFAQTLIAAAMAAERWPLARALLAERVALKPASRRSWAAICRGAATARR